MLSLRIELYVRFLRERHASRALGCPPRNGGNAVPATRMVTETTYDSHSSVPAFFLVRAGKNASGVRQGCHGLLTYSWAIRNHLTD